MGLDMATGVILAIGAYRADDSLVIVATSDIGA